MVKNSYLKSNVIYSQKNQWKFKPFLGFNDILLGYALGLNFSESKWYIVHHTFYRWLLTESLIGSNPGVGVRPGTSDLHIDSSMYLLNSQDKDKSPSNKEGEGEKNIDYARRMEMFLKGYDSKSAGLVSCDGSDVSISWIFSKHL